MPRPQPSTRFYRFSNKELDVMYQALQEVCEADWEIRDKLAREIEKENTDHFRKMDRRIAE